MMEKKGFTILELIAVIFILSLVILLFISSYGSTTNNIMEERHSAAEEILGNAIDIYYHLGLSDGSLQYYPDGTKINTCIKLKTLVENGYLAEENTLYDAGSIAILEVDNGKIKWEIAGENDAKVAEKCFFDQVNLTGITHPESQGIDNYTFSQTISLTDINTFKIDTDFTFKTLLGISIKQPNTYVIMSLDTSGSMGVFNNISNANEAVTALFNDFSSSEYNVCLAFIDMSSEVRLVQPFTNQTFTAHAVANDAENYTHSLWMAYDMFFTPEDELPKYYLTGGPPDIRPSGSTVVNSALGTNVYSVPECNGRLEADNKILLFMSDGYPESRWVVNTMYDAANKFKDKGGKIITYRYGTGVPPTTLENIASNDCIIGGVPNSPCMYQTGSYNFVELLQEFVAQTIEEIRSQSIKARIDFELNDYFNYTNTSNLTANPSIKSYPLNLEENVIDNWSKQNIYDLEVAYNGKEFPAGVNPYKVDMFKSITIVLMDKDGDEKERIAIDSIPAITLYKSKNASALN